MVFSPTFVNTLIISAQIKTELDWLSVLELFLDINTQATIIPCYSNCAIYTYSISSLLNAAQPDYTERCRDWRVTNGGVFAINDYFREAFPSRKMRSMPWVL
jgi:hypothetical protein